MLCKARLGYKVYLKQLRDTMVMAQSSQGLNQQHSGYKFKFFFTIFAMQKLICFGINAQGSGHSKKVFF